MKFNRIFIGLAGLVGGLLSVTSQAQLPNQGAPVASGQAQRQSSAQALVQWLTSRNIMDSISANELALSLSEQELNALVAALKNPMVLKAAADAIPIRES